MQITQQNAQEIVDEMKASIHRDINIIDENGVILASTNPVRRGTVHHGALQLIQNNLPSLTIWKDDPDTGVQRGINLPITINGQLTGVIGITGDPDDVSVFGEIIKRMTEIMLESIRQQEQLDLIDQAKSLFVENWLFSKETDWSELEIRGRLLGFDINDPYTIACLKLTGHEAGGSKRAIEDLREIQNGLILRVIQNHIRDNNKHFCAIIRSKILVLLYNTDRNESYNKINKICQDIESHYGLGMSGGISDISGNPADIRRCCLEAETAAAAASGFLGHQIIFYDQVSFDFIVQSIPQSVKQNLKLRLFSSCTPKEREDFAQTIKVYFEQKGEIAHCADKLFIHRNTFQYRMDRIREKTGYNLRVPQDAFLLYLTALEIPNES